MVDKKPWYLSKAIWGGVTAVIATTTGIMIDPSLAIGLATNVIAVIGGLVSIWGRVVAKSEIGKP